MSRFALFLFLVLLALPVHADEAGEVHASVRTLGLVTGQSRPGTLAATDVYAPTLQLLSAEARNAGGTGVFGSASGFLAQQWATGPSGHSADLMAGSVGWEGVGHRLRVQAGRLGIFAGAANYVFLDGAATTVRLPGDIRVDGYGGTGVYETFSRAFRAPVYGGRVAWVPFESGHIGLAAQAIDDVPDGSNISVAARRTVGVDAALRIYKPLLLTGSYAYDLLMGGLAEARLDAGWRISKFLSVHSRGEIRDPLAFLPKTSIFNAFVARTDGMVGGGIDLDTPGALSLASGYDRFIVGSGGMDGYRTFTEARLKVDAAGRYRTGLQYARLYNGENGYDQIRAFLTFKPDSRWTVTGDIDGYQFFQAIHGETLSTRALVATRWTATPGIVVGLDAQIWRNPYFDTQALGMLSLLVDERLRAQPTPVVAVEPPKAKADDEDEEADKPAKATP